MAVPGLVSGRPEVESQIARLLVDKLGVRPDLIEACDNETPLLGSGVGLDSVEAMTLASEIEAAFDIFFEDDELHADLFKTIGSLAAAVRAKKPSVRKAGVA